MERLMALGIAATGLAFVLFLLLHLGGVSLALLAPASFEQAAIGLHAWPGLVPLELTLAVVALAHPALSLHRVLANRRARGPVAGPLHSRRSGADGALAALAARAVPWSGALLLVFLGVHLAQLRWHRPAPGQELAALLAVLGSPFGLALYVLAGACVALHLFHGHESAHRSLGLLDAANGGRIRIAGRLVAVGLGTGFALLPVALLLRGPLPGGPLG